MFIKLRGHYGVPYKNTMFSMLILLSNLNNNRQASIPKIRQNSLVVNQQATNHVDRSRMGEAVREIFPIKRKSNPTDTRRINSKPDIETNRNFLYPATTYYSRPAHSRSRTKCFSVHLSEYLCPEISFFNVCII